MAAYLNKSLFIYLTCDTLLIGGGEDGIRVKVSHSMHRAKNCCMLSGNTDVHKVRHPHGNPEELHSDSNTIHINWGCCVFRRM